MHAVFKGPPHWRWMVFAALFCVFCSAFYLPISSKATNNIFYAGLAVPGLIWLLWRPAALPVLASAFIWMILPLAALVILDANNFPDLKKGLYLLLFFTSCLLLEQKRWGGKKCFTVFALFSAGILVSVVGDWLWIWSESGRWVRYDRFLGQQINPVYFALLIISGLTFLWLFYLDEWLARHTRAWWLAGLLLLCGLVLCCAIIFQARSALLGFVLFLGVYLLHRRLLLQGALVLLPLVALLLALGGDELLAHRGFSYRPAIWWDAWLRVLHECGLWLGCDADGYRFVGQFHHPHSGYVAMFYRNGLLGATVFIVFSAIFFWRGIHANSRWMLLALVGWGSLLTTTNGVLTTPQPLWVYFWLPTFMAILENQQSAVDTYFAARRAPPVASV